MKKKSIDKPTLASIVVYCLFFALYCAYDAAGLVLHDSPWLTPGVACAFSAMLVILAFRQRIKGLLDPHREVIKPVLCAVLVITAFYLIERPYNSAITDIPPYFIALNLVAVAALFCIVYFVGQQTKISAVLFLTACFITGMANYFVISFKGQPILPADLFALSTAASVGSNYTYAIDANTVKAFVMLAFGGILVGFLPKPKPVPYRGLANAGVALICVLSFATLFIDEDIEQAYGCKVDVWSAQDSYAQNGSLLCFLKRVQDLTPIAPAGYSHEAVEEILANYTGRNIDANEPDSTGEASADPIGQTDYAAFPAMREPAVQSMLSAPEYDEGAPLGEENGSMDAHSEQPAVIVIMNETFSDLTEYSVLADSYEGPLYYNSIADTSVKGNAYVSALGGGTCNSEFEFLTGSSMGSLGGGVYPYVLYDMDGTENLAAYFNALGYDTTAIHPENPTNWRRDVVYGQLGFDSFIDISEFEHADRLRDMVTDRETYRVILELLAQNDAPQFIFDVTMQNHGGYDTGDIPEELMVSAPIDGIAYPELDEYVSSIRQTDNDLAYLIEGLKELDRPVILCFFGDHQPGFADWLSELEYGKPVEDFALDEVQKRYTVPYLIWKNFDSGETGGMPGQATSIIDQDFEVLAEGSYGSAATGGADGLLSYAVEGAGTQTYDLSLNYLGSLLVKEAGLPMTDYQQFLLAIQSIVPAVNLNGYMGIDSQWYWIGEESSASEALYHYALVQYDNLFDRSDETSFTRFVSSLEQRP